MISPIEPLVVIAKISHTSGKLFHTSNRQQMIKVTAQMMREIVNEYVENEKKTDSVWPPTVESLRLTRLSCPPLLTSFFTQLLKTKEHSAGESVQRAVESMTDDIIHSVSNGTVFTLKHTLIGCGIHSLTGSRQTIDNSDKLNNS